MDFDLDSLILEFHCPLDITASCYLRLRYPRVLYSLISHPPYYWNLKMVTSVDEAVTLDSKSTSTLSKRAAGLSAVITAVPEQTPQEIKSISLNKLFKPWGSLTVDASDVKDFKMGSFKVRGIISNNGAQGLVVSCIDTDNAIYAMKIERRRDEMDADAIAHSEISAHGTIAPSLDLRVLRL
jgi:hypothetical protein